MASTDTLQGLQGQSSPSLEGAAKAPGAPERSTGATASNGSAISGRQIAAEARELFTKEENPPLAVGFCAVDPPYYQALLAFAGVLMEMGLKVSIDTTHGPHPLTGEHMSYIRCEGFPNVQ